MKKLVAGIGGVLAAATVVAAVPATAFAANTTDAGTTAAANAAYQLVPMPGVSAPTVTAAPVKGDSPYSVTITQAPTSTVTNGSAYQLISSSTGFSSGNWLNVWIRPTGATQWQDDGGNWVPAGANVSSSVSFPYNATATSYQIQLSMGKNPNEQYSQIMTVNYTPGDQYQPQIIENGINGIRYVAVFGNTTKAKPGTTLPITISEGNQRTLVNATVNADGSYQYIGQGSKMDKVITYTADPSGSQGGSSTYYNYYI